MASAVDVRFHQNQISSLRTMFETRLSYLADELQRSMSDQGLLECLNILKDEPGAANLCLEKLQETIIKTVMGDRESQVIALMERVSYLEAREESLERCIDERESMIRDGIHSLRNHIPADVIGSASQSLSKEKLSDLPKLNITGSPEAQRTSQLQADLTHELEVVSRSIDLMKMTTGSATSQLVANENRSKMLEAELEDLRSRFSKLHRKEDEIISSSEMKISQLKSEYELIIQQMKERELYIEHDFKKSMEEREIQMRAEMDHMENAFKDQLHLLDISREQSLSTQESVLRQKFNSMEDQTSGQIKGLQIRLEESERLRNEAITCCRNLETKFSAEGKAERQTATENINLLVERVQAMKVKMDRLKEDLDTANKTANNAVSVRDEAVSALKKLMATEQGHSILIHDLQNSLKGSVLVHDHKSILQERVESCNEKWKLECERQKRQMLTEKEEELKRASSKAKEDLATSLVQIRRGVQALEHAKDEHSRLRSSVESERDYQKGIIRQLELNVHELQVAKKSVDSALVDSQDSLKRIQTQLDEELRRRRDAEGLVKRVESELKMEARVQLQSSMEEVRIRMQEELSWLRNALESTKKKEEELSAERDLLLKKVEELKRSNLELRSEAGNWKDKATDVERKQKEIATDTEKKQKQMEEETKRSKDSLMLLMDRLHRVRSEIGVQTIALRRELNAIRLRVHEDLRVYQSECISSIQRVENSHTNLRKLREAKLLDRINFLESSISERENTAKAQENSLRLDIDRLTQRLASELAIQKAKLEADRDSVTAKLQAEILTLKSIAESENASAEQRVLAETNSLEMYHQQALSSLESKLKAEKESERMNLIGQLSQIREEAKFQILTLEQRHDKALSAIREEARQQILNAEEQKRKLIQEAQEQSKKVTDEVEARANARVKRAEDSLEEITRKGEERVRLLEEKMRLSSRQSEGQIEIQLRSAEDRFDRLIKEEQMKASQEVREATERTAAIAKEAHERANNSIRAALDKAEWEIKNANDRCNVTCRDLSDRFDREMREFRDNAASEIRELQAALDLARRSSDESLRLSIERHEAIIQDWESKYSRDVIELKAKQENLMKELKDAADRKLNSEIDAYNVQFRATTEELKEREKNLKIKLTEAEASLTTSKSLCATLEGKVKSDLDALQYKSQEEIQAVITRFQQEVDNLKDQQEYEKSQLKINTEISDSKFSLLQERMISLLNCLSNHIVIGPSLKDRLVDCSVADNTNNSNNNNFNFGSGVGLGGNAGSPNRSTMAMMQQSKSPTGRLYSDVLKEFEEILLAELKRIQDKLVDPLKDRIQQSEAEKLSLNERIAMLSIEMNNMTQALNSLKTEKSRLEADRKDQEIKSKELQIVIEGERKVKKEQEKELQEQLAMKEKIVIETRTGLETALRERLSDLEEVVQSLRKEYEAEMRTIKENHAVDMSNAKKENEKRLSEIERVKELDLQTLKSQFDRCKKEQIAIEDELRSAKQKIKESINKAENAETSMRRHIQQGETDVQVLQASLHKEKLLRQQAEAENHRNLEFASQRQATLNKLETISNAAAAAVTNSPLKAASERNSSLNRSSVNRYPTQNNHISYYTDLKTSSPLLEINRSNHAHEKLTTSPITVNQLRNRQTPPSRPMTPRININNNMHDDKFASNLSHRQKSISPPPPSRPNRVLESILGQSMRSGLNLTSPKTATMPGAINPTSQHHSANFDRSSRRDQFLKSPQIPDGLKASSASNPSVSDALLAGSRPRTAGTGGAHSGNANASQRVAEILAERRKQRADGNK